MKTQWRIEKQLELYKKWWGKSGRRIKGKSSRWKRKGDIISLEWLCIRRRSEEEVISMIEELKKTLENPYVFPTQKYQIKGEIRSLRWSLE